MIFEVTLLLPDAILIKSYPLAMDEREARSMMFRDCSDQIMKVVFQGGRVLYDVVQITPEQMKQREGHYVL